MPFLDIPHGDVGDLHVPEPGQDLVAQVVSVNLAGGRLPVTGIAVGHPFGDHREQGLTGRCHGWLALSDGSQRDPCRIAYRLHAHLLRFADDLPDPPPVTLCVNEASLPSRR